MVSPELVVLLIPAILFCIDLMGKAGFRCSLDSVGVDLCMFAVSFNVSTLLLDKLMRSLVSVCRNPSAEAFVDCMYAREATVVLALLISLAAWLLSLMLSTAHPGPLLVRLRKWHLDSVIAVILGMSSFYLGIYVYYALG